MVANLSAPDYAGLGSDDRGVNTGRLRPSVGAISAGDANGHSQRAGTIRANDRYAAALQRSGLRPVVVLACPLIGGCIEFSLSFLMPSSGSVARNVNYYFAA